MPALFALIALVSFFAAQPDPLADISPVACPYKESANYRPDAVLTVEAGVLKLVDSTSGAVLFVLDTEFMALFPGDLYWEQNCRYAVAFNVWRPDGEYPRRFTSVYDTFTGRRVFHTGREPYGLDVIYSPSMRQFLIKSITGLYLMNEAMDAPVLLFNRYRYGNAMRYYRWDMARGELVVNFWQNAGYTMIYDIDTSETIAAISVPDACTPFEVDTVSSGRYLIVYTYRGDPACVTVYDRDAHTVIAQVNAERLAFGPDRMAVSPDGRYLVIGFEVLRVWDLTAQPEDFAARLPQFRHDGPEAAIFSLAFVDATTIETTSDSGVQRWDVVTGEAAAVPGE